VRRVDNLTTFVCRLSWNLGSSASWNSQGLSRPVMGLLYRFAFHNRISFIYHRRYVSLAISITWLITLYRGWNSQGMSFFVKGWLFLFAPPQLSSRKKICVEKIWEWHFSLIPQPPPPPPPPPRQCKSQKKGEGHFSPTTPPPPPQPNYAYNLRHSIAKIFPVSLVMVNFLWER